MTLRTTLVLTFYAMFLGARAGQAEPAGLVGTWQVEVTFREGATRSLRFEARDSGKGSFLLAGPKPNEVGPLGLPGAEWAESHAHVVSFAGPVQFPLGNVGLERGTLVLQGKREADGRIAGTAAFFAVEQNPKDPKAEPARTGTFRATRVAGG